MGKVCRLFTDHEHSCTLNDLGSLKEYLTVPVMLQWHCHLTRYTTLITVLLRADLNMFDQIICTDSGQNILH